MKEGKHIFEEVRVGRLRLRNRLVRSATWLGLAAPDGTLPEEAFATYRELAEGGVGAIEASGNGTSVAGVRPGRGEAYFLPFAAHDAFAGVALEVLHGEVADEFVIRPVAPRRDHFLRVGRRKVRVRKLAVHLPIDKRSSLCGCFGSE